MLICLDQGIKQSVIVRLDSLGHEVVRVAEHGESDEDWVYDGVAMGAEVFVSSDLDIPNLLDLYGSKAHWIELPQGKINQLNFILKEIKKIGRGKFVR